MNSKESGNPRTSEYVVTGEALLAKVKEIIAEGNARRLTIKNEDGRSIIEIPLTLGVVGALLLPALAAVGAIAALAARYTLVVERLED